ncbi:hypothetical protein THAPS_263321 [Thalassiosira pseudonana CCMP1335]
MENEKKLEDQIDADDDAADADSKTTNNDSAISTTTNNIYDNEESATPHSTGRWEELHGNYILRPPNEQQPPRALLHFLGGALLGAAPQLTYRYLLERLSSRGYLIVATPYELSFDHLGTCDEIIDKFERVAPSLAKQYGPVPVVGVGHSCGALLHMLITSLFPDTPRAANALISYNNRGVGEAVPLFDELSLLNPSLLTIPTPLRQTLTNFLTEPTYGALTNAGVTQLLVQSLDITQQIPKLIDEVEAGARDFVPTPDAMSSAARRAYRCRRTLLLQFESDNLDDSEQLEGYLKEAESVMKMKRPMITIDLKRQVLPGNHLTPLLGPAGGEDWGKMLEETLGGVLGFLNPGGEMAEKKSGDGGDSAKVVRERLGYEQVERVAEELVVWLDEGSL